MHKKVKPLKKCDNCLFRHTKECTKNTPCDLGMTVSQFRMMITNILRQRSYYWKPGNEALKNARKEVATYQCVECKDWIFTGELSNIEKIRQRIPKDVVFRSGEVKKDHNPPIVPTTGFDGWDNFIKRMFCFVQGYQILCKECHDVKTLEEKIERSKKKR